MMLDKGSFDADMVHSAAQALELLAIQAYAAMMVDLRLTTVRDNLRHASISTASIYLHGDEVKRARQMGAAFAAPARE
ncbi:hypothetical protein [Polaromonas sp.]|uniref:hypothetical protein n=1 Tax=Polaromonas sp. TaxID=1869339 RepID=UPI003FA6FE4C